MTNLDIRGGAGDITKPDVKVRPQDNLYLAVNSEWLENNDIPSDRSRIARFDKIDIEIEKKLMQDFADFASGKKEIPAVPNLEKAVEFYKLAADFDKRNDDGAEPIQEDLKRLTSLNSLAEIGTKEFYTSMFALPFSFSVNPNMKNTKENMVDFNAPGLILPDTTSYQDPSSEKLLAVYKQQALNLLKMAGVASEQAQEYVENALKFDARLAKVVKSSEEAADYTASYNPTKLADFTAKINNLDIKQLLTDLFGKMPEVVNVTEPRYLEHFDELVNEENFAEIKGWIITHFINSVASYLSQDFREAAFPFRQALSGQPELASQIKHAYRMADSSFSDVVGVYYGQTYFGEAAKKDVEDMIHKMIDAYESRIKNNDWLSEETKQKAIVKLRALILKIGYPDKIEKIYDKLQVNPASLYETVKANNTKAVEENLAKLYKPVDRTTWLMPGNLVNACYDPQRNDITFPAAILQAPFYDVNADRATNYGGIGTVIAHEISHAFDNNGAKFDEFGNLNNWWAKEDYAEFKKRTQAEIDLFDGIKFGNTVLNGKQIVSENIADQGGLTAAISANKSEGGDAKKLFENFARIWGGKEYPEYRKMIVSIDVHAPGPERANVQSQQQEEFYKAFDVKESDGMWMDPEKRVIIW
ncbi:M13 family peptidase [Lactobacillus sp. PV037]|uniref:M13 family metallopeptidase n=1 Tax=Lactobacillus sp. PV037 TaxID=2594496 RepID=UPI0022404A00|nr:M13-type metalloendopeptidase [Lactobacillus sp. PV037]QNQ84220.1 M13 family peptidase [Lactobacillus sp. PV037]